MRMLQLLLLTIAFFFSVSIFAQRVTLSEAGATLDKVLQDIQAQTEYLYTVDRACIRAAGKLTFSVADATVAMVMDQCLGDLPIYYRVLRRSINVYPGTFVWGQVVDDKGQGIAGATVMTTEGDVAATATDESGRFRLRLLGRDRSVMVSCVGYEGRRYIVSGTMQLQVMLSPRAGELNGVVVSNGFEDIPAERATGSFAHVNREQIGRRPSASLLDRLDGVTPSLLVNKNIQAGTNQSAITIRGRSTIFSSPDPLIVIDNFPYSGDLNNINPEDVESVTILKDAAAASVWGTRAANGVIVVKTKQGSYKQPLQLSFSSSLTLGQRPDLYYSPRLSSSDYIDVEQFLFGQGFYNNRILDGSHPALSPAVEILLQQREGKLGPGAAAAQLDQLRGQDTRRDLGRYWYQPSVNQQYWLGLTGGTASSRFALSAGLDQDRSSLTRNGYQRVTVMGNHSYMLLPHVLELTTNLAFTSSRNDQNNPGIATAYPYLRLADAGGKATAVPFLYRLGYADTVGGGRLLDWHYRPLDELHNASNAVRLTDWRLNMGLQYTIGKRWKASGLYQYAQGSSDQQDLQSLAMYFTRNLLNAYTQPGPGGQLSYPIPVGGILDETQTNYQSHNGRLQVEYHPLLGADHDLHLLAGSEIQSVEGHTKVSRVYGYSSLSQTGLPVSSYTTLYPQYSSNSSLMTIPFPDNSIATSDHYRSYYMNGAYQYRQRYTLTASARLDQSNLFGVDINHKTVPLWSAGVAWEASREDFYHSNWLPFLRLRMTNGYNGNVYKSISGYTTANLFTSTVTGILPSFLNAYGAPAASITNPPNPHLRWERVQVVNVGLDFASKDSLLQGSVEYYTKHGQYLIGPAGLDPTSGNTDYTANVANMTSHGIDLSLKMQWSIGPVRYNGVILFNYVRDKVTRYLVQPPTIQTFLNAQTINPLVGRPLYSLYALGWAGLEGQMGNPQGWLNGQRSQDYGALIGATDFHTLLYKGPANPPVFGSWRHTFDWKQWGLSFNITYKFGHYFLRPSIDYQALFNGNSFGHPDYASRWQHPGDEQHTTVPSMVYPGNAARDAFYNVSAVLVEKADHIRLQDVQLYYDFTKKSLSRLPVHLLRVYGYVNNIGILWRANHHGIDPDVVSGLPDPRTIAIGVRIQ